MSEEKRPKYRLWFEIMREEEIKLYGGWSVSLMPGSGTSKRLEGVSLDGICEEEIVSKMEVLEKEVRGSLKEYIKEGIGISGDYEMDESYDIVRVCVGCEQKDIALEKECRAYLKKGIESLISK
jgi:hypothetical protein